MNQYNISLLLVQMVRHFPKYHDGGRLLLNGSLWMSVVTCISLCARLNSEVALAPAKLSDINPVPCAAPRGRHLGRAAARGHGMQGMPRWCCNFCTSAPGYAGQWTVNKFSSLGLLFIARVARLEFNTF